MDDDSIQRPPERHVPAVLAGTIITISVLTRTGTSILTPLWLDALNTDSANHSSCDIIQSDRSIDAYTIIFITNFLFVVLFGVILLLTKCFCPHLITDKERNYNKRDFVAIGVSDTLSAILFVYASSGCRTAPYLQSIADNFSVPVVFVIRFLVLRKRPTCRKTLCAMLVLFAEFTALLTQIDPGLEPNVDHQDEGGAPGLAGILWPVCFFLGYIPLALVTTVIEKTVKTPPGGQRGQGSNADINIAYVLFWSYLSSLITLVLLFWTDVIPGFGMRDGPVDFAKGFWFNIKCYIGLEGCRGLVNVFSILCTALLVLNRLVNAYFLRYLEGANYLVIITTITTPLVFLFFTLFDEHPLGWHPHAYLSTYLSITALCIMLPAIYIYNTGAPEVQPDSPDSGCLCINTSSQTDENEPLLRPNVTYDDPPDPHDYDRPTSPTRSNEGTIWYTGPPGGHSRNRSNQQSSNSHGNPPPYQQSRNQRSYSEPHGQNRIGTNVGQIGSETRGQRTGHDNVLQGQNHLVYNGYEEPSEQPRLGRFETDRPPSYRSFNSHRNENLTTDNHRNESQGVGNQQNGPLDNGNNVDETQVNSYEGNLPQISCNYGRLPQSNSNHSNEIQVQATEDTYFNVYNYGCNNPFAADMAGDLRTDDGDDGGQTSRQEQLSAHDSDNLQAHATQHTPVVTPDVKEPSVLFIK